MLNQLYSALATIAGTLSIYTIASGTFKLIPDLWLCDYHQPLRLFPQKSLPHLYHSSRLALFLNFLFLLTFVFLSCGAWEHHKNSAFFFFETPQLWNIFSSILLLLIFSHIFICDFLFTIIPDQYITAMFIISVLDAGICCFRLNQADPMQSLLTGTMIGFLPLFALLAAGYTTKKKALVGFGDIKLMAALGAILGYGNILYLHIFAFLTSAVFALALQAYIKIKASLLSEPCSPPEALPMAPFILGSLPFLLFCTTA